MVARFVSGSNPLAPNCGRKGGATYPILTGYVGSPEPVVDTTVRLVIQGRDYDAGGLDDSDTGLVRASRAASRPLQSNGDWGHLDDEQETT